MALAVLLSITATKSQQYNATLGVDFELRMRSGFCINLEGAYAGGEVRMAPCSGATTQQWVLLNGRVSPHSTRNLCLNVGRLEVGMPVVVLKFAEAVP